MLFQDAQNLLEFDPNFENALSLPFLGKKSRKNSTFDGYAFVSLEQTNDVAIAFQEKPPSKLHPSQLLFSLFVFWEVSFFIYIFTGIN